MKHCVSFSLLALFVLSLASCAKHDEITFRGTVVNIEYCASQDIQSNAGFYTALEMPEGTGADFTIGTETYHNVIILYEPGMRIQNGNHISGKFYLDDKYSRTNCTMHIHADDNLPQGVFTEVSVD
ncbi:MAG: hypothetical protein IKJ78_08185 [Bacteroidales bacterium]|nr:hypothetical protein [Bacteroidales bacterium]